MVAPASNDDDDDDTITTKGEDVIDRLLVGYKRFRREKIDETIGSEVENAQPGRATRVQSFVRVVLRQPVRPDARV